ncbi:MAG: flippase-like domain-containing protein [Deltaproteobacteria bacterium]|nr:flippase-like domain-containing protein [Deltaproteobacteria bacterium]
MRRALQALAGLAVSGVALWLTLRGKDLSAIWRAGWEADHRYLLGYLLTASAIHFARTVRWRILLDPVARIPFARINAACAVGFMALFILPLRIGEFARPYLVAQRPALRVSAALSSVVVERVADGVFTAGMLVLALLAVPEGTANLPLLRGAGWVMLGLFAGLVAFLVVAYRSRDRAVSLTRRLLAPLSPRLADRVGGMMDAFIHGLRQVPGGRGLATFLLLTVAYWGLNGLGMLILARGFGITLDLVQAFTVLGVLVVGVMIPAGPGMVGTFQYAVVLALSLFVPREVVDVRGQAYANVLWGAQLFQLTLFGLVALFSRHIRLAAIFRAPGEIESGLEEEERDYQAQEAGRGKGGGA